MSATRAKTAYLKQQELRTFCARNDPQWLFLLTGTFHENITEKAEAQKRFKCIRDYLTSRGIDFDGVWQQQKRGAWHYHVFINRYLDIAAFRSFVTKRGWGTFCNVEPVGNHHGGSKFQSVEGAVRYVTRYLTRDYCGHVPLRVRLTIGRKVNSVGTTKFSWVGGLARVWRMGCNAMGRVPHWKDYKGHAEVWRRGCTVMGLDYVEVMHRLCGVISPGGCAV